MIVYWECNLRIMEKAYSDYEKALVQTSQLAAFYSTVNSALANHTSTFILDVKGRLDKDVLEEITSHGYVLNTEAEFDSHSHYEFTAGDEDESDDCEASDFDSS